MDAKLYVVNVEAAVWRPPSPPTLSPRAGEGASEGCYLMIVRGLTEEIAPGTLTPPGGKVEVAGAYQDVLEATLRREVLEETGVEVADEVAYVESHLFEGGGQAIVDIVFLARYRSGEPRAEDDEEVAGIEWVSFEQLMADPRTMPWTRETMQKVEAKRRELGW